MKGFLGVRRKCNRDRSAAGNLPVLGIFQQDGRVYPQVIPNSKRKTFISIIEEMIVPDGIVYGGPFPRYKALDVEAFRRFRIKPSMSLVKGQIFINGIENFWNEAKRDLLKYNGIPQHQLDFFQRM